MPSEPIKIAVVGYGYWGPNLVRNFARSNNCQVAIVSDFDASKLASCARQYPGIATTTRFRDIVDSAEIGAVAIATPAHSHFELAMTALKAGKHVLVEKPLAQSSDEVRRLIDEAMRRDLTLMVDHTFVYTPAVQKIRQLIAEGALGKIYYYNGTRASLGLFQRTSTSSGTWRFTTYRSSSISWTKSPLLFRRPEPCMSAERRKTWRISRCSLRAGASRTSASIGFRQSRCGRLHRRQPKDDRL